MPLDRFQTWIFKYPNSCIFFIQKTEIINSGICISQQRKKAEQSSCGSDNQGNTRKYYRSNFRQVFVLLRTLRFMCSIRLDATSCSQSSISWQLQPSIFKVSFYNRKETAYLRTNSSCYLCINITSNIKTYLDKKLHSFNST